jgi:hypothetical protein
MEIENDNTPHFLKNNNENLNQKISRPYLSENDEKISDISILIKIFSFCKINN